MKIPTLPGITAETITTDRITTRVLFAGPEDGIAVLFLHGNLSSATWWEETMVTLPDGYRAIGPDQRGFGEADPAAKSDATRGMRDSVDDAIALMDYLGHEKCHHLTGQGQRIHDEQLARLSPAGHEHINFYGRYDFTHPTQPPQGRLRPLRTS